MPEITANIVVEPIQLSVTETTQNLDVVVDSTNLSIYTATGIAKPAGNVGELQYHANGEVFGAIANTSVDANGNLVFTNVANLKIVGGASAYYLQTDGTGNLTWATGGTPTGNGVPSGANTLIQFSDGSGSFDSAAGFTYDKATNILNVPGNVVSTGLFIGDAGGLSNIVGANVTGEVSFAAVANSIDGANVSGTVPYAAIANSVAGANVSGVVANATHAVSADSATTAGTVTTNAQPNITSVGTLTSLDVTGNISVGGTSSIAEAVEQVTLLGAQSSPYSFDMLDGAIRYSTANATASLTLNFRGNSTVTLDSFLANGQSTVGTFLMTTGSSAYTVGAVQIDGSAQTIKWVESSAPSGSPNTTTSYTFTLIKTSTTPTYTVLGSFTSYA